MHELSIKGLAAAFGIVGAIMFVFIALVGAVGWNPHGAAFLGSLYPGVAPTAVGCLAAGLWGLILGAVEGGLIAWLYNRFR